MSALRSTVLEARFLARQQGAIREPVPHRVTARREWLETNRDRLAADNRARKKRRYHADVEATRAAQRARYWAHRETFQCWQQAQYLRTGRDWQRRNASRLNARRREQRHACSAMRAFAALAPS